MSQVSTLFKQATTANTRTQNGMAAHSTTNSHCMDLFFEIGSARNMDLSTKFSLAFAENADLAVRLLQYNRDIRQGQGERQMFRNLFAELIRYDSELASRVMVKIPELGRWDDVLVAINTPLEHQALSMVATALNNGLEAQKILETLDSLSEDQAKEIYLKIINHS